jgi:hypothetical protein
MLAEVLNIVEDFCEHSDEPSGSMKVTNYVLLSRNL